MRSTKPGEGTRRAAVRRVLLRLVLAAAAAGSLGAITITVSGSWSVVINASNLLGGPGTDLTPSLESPLNGVSLSIKQSRRRSWEISVRRIDGLWPAGLGLAVKRTSNGTGNGSISGGTAYQSVTAIDRTFFAGYRNRSNVALRYQLNGLSVAIPPGAYSTTIVYTIVETI